MFYHKEIKKYVKYALFQATLSKALNQQVGGCLLPVNSEIPIGAYNGPPRGIDEMKNWGRFGPNVREELWKVAEERFGQFWHGKHSIEIPHPKVDFDPRYLLNCKHGEGLKFQIDVHCETNLVINAARAGVSTVDSSVFLTCPIPCKNCATILIQAGVAEVHCCKSDIGLNEYDGAEYNYYMSRWLFKSSNTKLIEYESDILAEAFSSLSSAVSNFSKFSHD